jgi:hypothetical protein
MKLTITILVLIAIALGACDRVPFKDEWLFKRLTEQGQ